MPHVDLNADMGESFGAWTLGDDAALLKIVTSANIACGGHAGDKETMRAVVKLAKEHSVKIGAHPSFPDKENFGRIIMDMSCVALYTSIKNQIKDLISVLEEEHVPLHHIKPHGALYNLAAVDEKAANVIVEVVKALRVPVELYVPFKSVIADVAIQNNIRIFYEVFADRNYNNDLTLVSRQEKNALITDPDVMFEHVYNMILNGNVKTISGESVAINAQTICVHGDNHDAVKLISSLVSRLKSKGIKIR